MAAASGASAFKSFEGVHSKVRPHCQETTEQANFPVYGLDISVVIRRLIQLAAVDAYPHMDRLARVPVSALLNGSSLTALLERARHKRNRNHQ